MKVVKMAAKMAELMAVKMVEWTVVMMVRSMADSKVDQRAE